MAGSSSNTMPVCGDGRTIDGNGSPTVTIANIVHSCDSSSFHQLRLEDFDVIQ